MHYVLQKTHTTKLSVLNILQSGKGLVIASLNFSNDGRNKVTNVVSPKQQKITCQHYNTHVQHTQVRENNEYTFFISIFTKYSYASCHTNVLVWTSKLKGRDSRNRVHVFVQLALGCYNVHLLEAAKNYFSFGCYESLCTNTYSYDKH